MKKKYYFKKIIEGNTEKEIRDELLKMVLYLDDYITPIKKTGSSHLAT